VSSETGAGSDELSSKSRLCSPSDIVISVIEYPHGRSEIAACARDRLSDTRAQPNGHFIEKQ
jgi:hypothetical protein